MAFGQCGCVLNREVKNRAAKGSTGQDRGGHKMRSFTLENAGGWGSHGEVGRGGSGRMSVALLALLLDISFSEWRSLSCPLEVAAGLGRAAVGRRKWTGDSVSVSFLSDSGLDPFLRVVPGGPCGFSWIL